MRYNELGQTGLKVSELCLGTMTFGQQNSEAEGFAQLDRAVDAGINFIDTAEMYPVPTRAETTGRTEQIIGNWLKKTGKREQIILTTKVIGRSEGLGHIRTGACLNRENIQAALEGSLKRLNTDYLDLYQMHWPDRKTNFFGHLGYERVYDEDTVQIEETLGVLTDLVQSGKIRHIGVSNETPWGVMEYLRLADKSDLPRIVSIQNPYSLLNRSFEVGLAEIAHRESVGLLAYSPLAFGTLTGKYIDQSPPDGRLTLFPSFARYTNPTGREATREYVALARKYGLSPAQMALAFINSQPFLCSNIIGATTLEQLEENLGSADISLSDELFNDIESIHQKISNPCP